jgi:hypothetical protein
MERRTSASGGCPEWEVEARRRLAMWRQQLSMAKALVQGEIVVEVAAQKGVKINCNVDGSGFRECMESSSFQDIQVEAAMEAAKVGWQYPECRESCIQQLPSECGTGSWGRCRWFGEASYAET